MSEKFPGISKATIKISYDNGGIHRERTEATVLRKMTNFLAKSPLDREAIRAIDQWLSALTPADLSTVCCGEQSEMDAILAPAPPFTSEMLEEIFQVVA